MEKEKSNNQNSDAPKKDRAYWMSRTVEERMIELERLRQEKYGYDPNAKIERVFEWIDMSKYIKPKE